MSISNHGTDKFEKVVEENIVDNTVSEFVDFLGLGPFDIEPKSGKYGLCITCPLFRAPGPVPGEGPLDAKIVLLGEAPGEEESTVQYAVRRLPDGTDLRIPQPLRPFIGGSGRVLNRMLSQAGVRRDECFVTNTVKCRPPGNRKPTDDEIRSCAPLLARELEAIRPNVVGCLGATGLYATTGRPGIYEHRGVALEVQLKDRVQKVFGTLHPAHIMREASQPMWPVVVHDLERISFESTFPEVRRRPCSYDLDASLASRGEYIARRARDGHRLNYDLETTNLDPSTSQVIIIGIAVDDEHADVFRWTPEVAKWFFSLTSDPAIEIEGQNNEGFDNPFLEAKGATFRGPSFDLLQGFHLLHSDFPKDLGFIMSCETDMEYHKDSMKQNLFLYNGKDTLGARRSCSSIRPQMEALGLMKLYRTKVEPLQPVLRKMSRTGIKIDELKAASWSINLQRLARTDEAKLQAVVGAGFNPHSSKQVMKLLYETMGLPVQYVKDPKTKQMRPTANNAAIEKLAGMINDPILRLINRVRQLDHTRATYVDVRRDDRSMVHPRFGSAKAGTGRLNSWDPNFQNVPVELRELYIPDDEESVFIAADWTQVETRAAMVLSGDPVGLEYLSSGIDILRAIAAEVYNIPLASVTDEIRFLTKFVWYGLAYGRGAADIAKQTKRDQKDVQAFINGVQARFSRWHAWRQGLEKEVERNNCIVTPFGRRRYWFTRQVTEMYNFPIQGTCADMMYTAIINADADIMPGARLTWTVHDDLGLCAHKSVAKQAYYMLKETMECKWPEIVAASRDEAVVKKFYPNGWYCPTEIHIGKNWAECKKGNKDLEKEILQ